MDLNDASNFQPNKEEEKGKRTRNFIGGPTSRKSLKLQLLVRFDGEIVAAAETAAVEATIAKNLDQLVHRCELKSESADLLGRRERRNMSE